MGYFANGTEGDMFEAKWCNRCVHEDDEKGCPVMLAHVLFSYEECNSKSNAKHMLDMRPVTITVTQKHTWPIRCAFCAEEIGDHFVRQDNTYCSQDCARRDHDGDAGYAPCTTSGPAK